MSNNAVNLVSNWLTMQRYNRFRCGEWTFFVLSEKPSDISAIVRKTVRHRPFGFEKCTQKHPDDILSSQCTKKNVTVSNGQLSHNYLSTINQISDAHPRLLLHSVSTLRKKFMRIVYDWVWLSIGCPCVFYISLQLISTPLWFGAKRLQRYKKHSNILSSMKLIN